MLRASAWLAALALVASACGGGGGGDDGGRDTAAEVEKHNRNETADVMLSVSMVGDLNVTFEKAVPSHFIVRRTTSTEVEAIRSQVVGTEPTEPIRFGTAAFLAGVAVLPYEGDGEYTIPVGSPYDTVNKAQTDSSQVIVGSSIKVDWWPDGDVKDDPETFMRRAQPCSVVVKARGTEGTVSCPNVTNEAQDKHFSLTLRWKAPPTPSATPNTAP